MSRVTTMSGVRRRTPVGAAVGVVLLLVIAWLGVRGLAAQRHLTAARSNLHTARAALLDRHLDDARVAIAAAGRDTARARTMTDDPVWRLAAAVPYAGRSFAVARGIATGADDLARAVLPAAVSVADAVDPKMLRGADGSVDVSRLQAAAPPLARAATRAQTIRSSLNGLPTAGVLSPIADARRELLAQTGEVSSALTGASTAVSIAPALLGQDRPRRYFVLIQQTSESRGTGGLPGGFAILEASRGRLLVTAEGSDADIRRGAVAPPPGVPKDYIERYADLGAFALWFNVNVSPDLPVVARVIAERWRLQAQQSIDGVIALDSIALADILRGAGPIPLPGGRQLQPVGIIDYLAVGQYRDFAPPAGTSGIDRSGERKQVLKQISRAATGRLVSGGGDSDVLLRGLIDAVRSGHLRMASDDPSLSPALARSRVDGRLPQGPAPVAYPVVFNSTGGKLDYFLDRQVTYTAGGCSSGRRDSRIEVGLTNRAPASGLPPYLTTRIGGDGVTSTTSNSVTLTVYGTRGATLRRARLDGTGLTASSSPPLGSFVEDGLPAWHILLELPRNLTRRFVLELSEPAAPGAARVPQQPLARALTSSIRVPEC